MHPGPGEISVEHNLLPEVRSVLAVVAHPDDESFGLGSVLSEFAKDGANLAVLCFTMERPPRSARNDPASARSAPRSFWLRPTHLASERLSCSISRTAISRNSRSPSWRGRSTGSLPASAHSCSSC